jgi:hypothetical protein
MRLNGASAPRNVCKVSPLSDASLANAWMSSFRHPQNPKRQHGDHAGDDENRAGSDDEIDIAASVGEHHQSERHQDAADGY